MAPKFVERRQTPSTTKLIAPDAKPRRILLVEDNQDIREMIATALEGQGYQVDPATLPEEGIALLRQARYHLVVAHYNLPGKTATVMLKEAAAEGLLKATTTLIVTAHPDPEGVEPATIVRKPLDLTRFLLQVQKIFGSADPPPPKDRRKASVTVELALYVNKVSQVHLQVFDVADEPLAGEEDQVVFTPTLVKRSPPPRAWVVGDLSDHSVVISLLDIAGIQRQAEADKPAQR
jgi:CheY-like chemotaxis protein